MGKRLILVGGGLANSLIAYRLAQRRPELDLVLLERDARLGGNHTWSFHASDLSPAAAEWIGPFVAHAWAASEVRFPGHARRLATDYRSITAERLHHVVSSVLGAGRRCGIEATDVRATRVRLKDWGELEADAVIDGRGQAPSAGLLVRYQKFLGLEVRTATPHGVAAPIIMDATVEQIDGYRFVYVLPFGTDRLLIEDTRYSDTPALGLAALREHVRRYAASRGWRIAEVVREEVGVLPIVLAGSLHAFWQSGAPDLPRAGMAAGLMHPTTGYTLPDAVRLADALCELPAFDAASVYALTRRLAESRWRAHGFSRLLNRMLFLAGPPQERYRILRRFYRLPEALIERFYAGELRLADKARLLIGRPPVPMLAALQCLSESGAQRRAERLAAGGAL
jgi:lycopene beta-cyclase